jgi:hypothetical protein
MNILDWGASLTTTGLLAVILWLGRNLIATRLTKSVEHEFNEKLELLRTQIREREERLKADLRRKETEIAALRSGALAALANRQVSLDKRRLDAVDQLWTSVIALAPARAIMGMMSVINFETAARRAEQDPKTRQVFEAMGSGFDIKTIDVSGAAKARPFLSPMVWAIYSAVNAVTMHAVMRWNVLRNGFGTQDFMDNEAIAKLLKIVLPHHSESIDKYGPSMYYHVLEELDARLLSELQNMLSGVEADKASIAQASEIVRHSSAVLNQASISNAQPPLALNP